MCGVRIYNHDVTWFQIPVHDAIRVSMRECIHDRSDHANCTFDTERAVKRKNI